MNKHWLEVGKFNELLVWVERNHRLSLNTLATAQEQRLRDRTDEFLQEQGLYQVDERLLKELLPKHKRPTTNLLKDKRFFLLRQIDGGVKIQPAMTISADFRSLEKAQSSKGKTPAPHVRIKVALAFMAGTEFRVIGYRFETPEGIHGASENAGEGTHDFFHAQPIVAFTKGGGISLDSLFKDGEYPDKQPSFPLAAECLVTFAVSVFVTLYGRDFLKDLIEQDVISREFHPFFGRYAAPKPGCCLSRI